MWETRRAISIAMVNRLSSITCLRKPGDPRGWQYDTWCMVRFEKYNLNRSKLSVSFDVTCLLPLALVKWIGCDTRFQFMGAIWQIRKVAFCKYGSEIPAWPQHETVNKRADKKPRNSQGRDSDCKAKYGIYKQSLFSISWQNITALQSTTEIYAQIEHSARARFAGVVFARVLEFWRENTFY